jgi:hypothetical protein
MTYGNKDEVQLRAFDNGVHKCNTYFLAGTNYIRVLPSVKHFFHKRAQPYSPHHLSAVASSKTSTPTPFQHLLQHFPQHRIQRRQRNPKARQGVR